MEAYWIEGLYITRRGVLKARKNGKISPVDIEPFAKSFWANNAQEALQLATEAIHGGEWTEGPKVSRTSEEQRMRSLGAPNYLDFLRQPEKKERVVEI